jgi:hypothetical protein
VVMDPVCKLILAVDVKDRTLAIAQRLVHQVTQVLAPECAPLFLTDGFREYLTALVTHYGEWCIGSLSICDSMSRTHRCRIPFAIKAAMCPHTRRLWVLSTVPCEHEERVNCPRIADAQ